MPGPLDPRSTWPLAGVAGEDHGSVNGTVGPKGAAALCFSTTRQVLCRRLSKQLYAQATSRRLSHPHFLSQNWSTSENLAEASRPCARVSLSPVERVVPAAPDGSGILMAGVVLEALSNPSPSTAASPLYGAFKSQSQKGPGTVLLTYS